MTNADQTKRLPLRWSIACIFALLVVILTALSYPALRQRQLNIELRKHDFSFDTKRLFDEPGWPSWIRDNTKGMFLREVGIGGSTCTTEEMKLIATLLSLTYEGGANKPATCRLALYYPSDVTDEGVAQLSGLKNLHELTIESPSITDIGASHLRSLPNLRKLMLNRTQLTDNGLVNLKGLTKLTILGLERTQITDRGVSHLSSLRRLKELRLEQTNITDAAIPDLAKLQSVRGLFVTGTRITPTGISRLQTLLPHTRIHY